MKWNQFNQCLTNSAVIQSQFTLACQSADLKISLNQYREAKQWTVYLIVEICNSIMEAHTPAQSYLEPWGLHNTRRVPTRALLDLDQFLIRTRCASRSASQTPFAVEVSASSRSLLACLWSPLQCCAQSKSLKGLAYDRMLPLISKARFPVNCAAVQFWMECMKKKQCLCVYEVFCTATEPQRRNYGINCAALSKTAPLCVWLKGSKLEMS